jgi:hypothetical protein
MTTARLPWIADPVALDERSIVFPEDGESATCVDLQTGKIRWKHPVSRPSSLVGKQLQLRRFGEAVLIGLERNQGMEIEAVSSKSGATLWARPLYLGDRPYSLNSLGFDGEVLYVPTEEGLEAISPATGKRLWEAVVPGTDSGEWRILCGKSHLLMLRRRALSLAYDNWEMECQRLIQSIPTLPRLARFVSKSYDALADRVLPVLVLEKSSGRLVQRLTFPARGLSADIRRSAKGLVVVTGAGVWGLETATGSE